MTDKFCHGGVHGGVIVSVMASEVGKREAHKIATRQAIQEAADRLFAERGYAETTVRDVADAAGVTERTLFRYFTGKEALLVRDIVAWLPTLTAEIRERPAEEGALDAIEGAIFSMRERIRDRGGPNLAWLFSDGPPGPKLEKSTPALLLRFEQAVADALDERLGRGREISNDEIFANQVLARCSVAALRSAGLRNWQIGAPQDGQADLIRKAFAVLRGAGA